MAKLQNDLYQVLDLLREDVLDPIPEVAWGESMTGDIVFRNRLVCADGFSVSVQMSWASYCKPRRNLACSADYESAELGYPNRTDELLRDYADDPEEDPDTVFPYVPMKVLEQVFQKHGGLHPKETIRLAKIKKQLEAKNV